MSKRHLQLLGILAAVCVGTMSCAVFADSADEKTATLSMEENSKSSNAASSEIKLSLDETYSYEELDTVLPNPLCGYAPAAKNPKLNKDATLVYIEVIWKELEPEEGVYDWDYIEEKNHIQENIEKGRHAILRFITDDPTDEAHMDIPQWLYDRTGDGVFYDISYGKGYCPNYDNETFIEAHENAIRALGEKYGNSGFVKFIEFGSLGHWGEWHTNTKADLPRIPAMSVRQRYLQPYYDSFPDARFMMRRPFPEIQDRTGLFNDLTGDPESTEEFLGWINDGGKYDSPEISEDLKAVPEIWNTAPVGGEFTSAYSLSELLIDNYDQTVSCIDSCHMTFVGPMIPNVENEEYGDVARDVLKHIGYRYRVSDMHMTSVEGSNTVTLELNIVNDGAAPVYWDYQPIVYIKNNVGIISEVPLDISLQEIGSGASTVCSCSIDKEMLPVGTEVFIGVVDPDTRKPSMNLYMDTYHDGFLYKLCDISSEI